MPPNSWITRANRTIRATVLCLGLVAAGCSQTTGPEAGAPPTIEPSAYAAEPYAFPRINRKKFDRRFWPADVPTPIDAPAGTILVDTGAKQLYWIRGDGTARRYGIAVGGSGHAWSGEATIGRKTAWPAWYPTDDMHAQTPGLPRRIEPGPHNPLGARAIYLYQGSRDTLYRIHGTSEPWTIGTEASSGCIRMLNEDAIELFAKAQLGAKVIVR